jgi:hypothetical protein
MTPKETKEKALRKNGKQTGHYGDPTSECTQAADQVRGRPEGPHKNGANEPELHYFIYAYQAGDTEAERMQSEAVIKKLDGRRANTAGHW